MTPRLLKLALFVVLGLLVASAALATTAGARSNSSQRQQSVTLRVVVSSAYVPATKIITANFTRVFPDVNFTIEGYPAAQLGTLYATQFRAGNGPDVFSAEPGHGSTYSVQILVNSGYVMDISGRKWEKRLPQQLLVGRKVGKALYSYPFGVTTFAMLYNIDLMSQLGVKVPTTYAEVLDACRKISAAGKIPIAWDPGDGGGGIRFPMMLAANLLFSKDPQWNVKRVHGEVSFANSDWVKIPAQMLEMKQANCFSPGVVGTSLAAAQGQMARGDAVMFATSTLDLISIPALNPNVHLAAFIFPAVREEDTRAVFSISAGYSVNAALTGAQKDAALAFIDFVAREKQSQTWARSAFLISPSDLKKGTVPSHLAPYFNAVVPILKRNNPVAMTYLWPNPLVFAALDSGMAGTLTGQLTAQQVVVNMDNAFNTGG